MKCGLRCVPVRVLVWEEVVQSFLSPPLYVPCGENTYGTLYTSMWEPLTISLRRLWPGVQVTSGLRPFVPHELRVDLGTPTV